MRESAWRYQPEFVIRLLINGEDPGGAVELSPSPAGAAVLRNQGVLTRSIPGGMLASLRQRPSGNAWIPAVEIDEPRVFSFWLRFRQGADFRLPDFFGQGSRTFGRQVFYANNLSTTGAIDSNLAGRIVSLTSASQAGDAERGALSGDILSARFTAGDFTLIRAGRISAGGPVDFSISRPIAPTDPGVALNFAQLPKGAYVVRLEGAEAIEERVVLDRRAAGAPLNGIIDIFREAWHQPPEPREYRADFAST